MEKETLGVQTHEWKSTPFPILVDLERPPVFHESDGAPQDAALPVGGPLTFPCPPLTPCSPEKDIQV